MSKKKYNLLIVDDEIMVIRSILRVLNRDEYNIFYTADPLEAPDILSSNTIDLMISDQRMPNMSGLELLMTARTVSPSTVRILMSGYSDIDIVIAAINDGKIYKYITKPWNNDKLIETVESAIIYKAENDEKAEILAYSLEKTENWNKIITQLNIELDKKKESTMNALLKVLKAKDYALYKHSYCVSETAFLISGMMGFTKDQQEAIRYAGLLHDIGKIAIRDRIMYKPGSLNDEEYEEMKNHPTVGADILREVDFLGSIADVVEQHHERIDGKGYPKGIHQEMFKMEAQILAVADTYEALREDRVYRKGMNNLDALQIIKAECTARFSPEIISTFIKAFNSASVNCINSACTLDK